MQIRIVKPKIALVIAVSFAALISNQPALAEQSQVIADEAFSYDLNDQAAIQRVTEETSLVADGGPIEKEGSGFSGGSGISWPKFELSNTESKIIGTFAFGYNLAKSDFSKPEPGMPQTINASVLKIGFKASAPFNGSENNDQIQFKHLGNNGKATLSITRFSASYKEGGARRTAVNRSLLQCFKETIDPYLNTLSLSERGPARVDAVALMAAYEAALALKPGKVGRDILDFDLDGQFSKFYSAAVSGCGGDIGENHLLQTYGKRALGADVYKSIARDFLNAGGLFFLGAEASLANSKHDVLNQANFEIDTIDRVGIDATAYVGYIGGNGKWSAKLSGGYARGYKAKDNAEFCIPAAFGTGQSCLTGENGKPTKETTTYVKAEGRLTLFKDNGGVRRIAVAPEVSLDIGEKDFLIDVPLFFHRTDGEGLSGGLRASYETGEKDFSMRLFVGLPFSSWF